MANLELVTEQKQQNEARKQEEESWKLTRAELADRVGQLRKELEAAKQRYEGALFDNFTDEMPRSLDVAGDNRAPHGAVCYLSPTIEGQLKRLQHEIITRCISDDVGELFFWSTDLAFQIGMLAGAIYADSPTATIDRFERGLVAALAACHWIIKE